MAQEKAASYVQCVLFVFSSLIYDSYLRSHFFLEVISVKVMYLHL